MAAVQAWQSNAREDASCLLMSFSAIDLQPKIKYDDILREENPIYGLEVKVPAMNSNVLGSRIVVC